MRLAFSSNAYLRYSFPEAARRIAALGYEGIEVMADVPHAWPAFLLEGQKAALRQALRDHRLTVSNINAFMMNAISDPRQPYWHPSWIERDPYYRQVRIEHTKRALELARDLGAPNITTEPGGPLEPGQPREPALKLFVEMLKPVADRAAKLGIPLLVEPEPGLLVETADQFEEFMGMMNHPAVGMNFDVGHAYCVQDDPAESIRRLARYIRHVHLEDIAATRRHHHLIPGDGAIDLPAVFMALKDIGYDGWVTVELYPYVDDPDTAAKTARMRVMEWMR